MAVDVHIVLEYKIDSYYEGLAFFSAPFRSSDFFSDLAGVRSYQSPIFPLRGFPDDVSDTTKYFYEVFSKGDYTHDLGWLNKSEFKKVCKKYSFKEIKAIIKAMSVLKKPRVIFWFDS